MSLKKSIAFTVFISNFSGYLIADEPSDTQNNSNVTIKDSAAQGITEATTESTDNTSAPETTEITNTINIQNTEHSDNTINNTDVPQIVAQEEQQAVGTELKVQDEFDALVEQGLANGTIEENPVIAKPSNLGIMARRVGIWIFLRALTAYNLLCSAGNGINYYSYATYEATRDFTAAQYAIIKNYLTSLWNTQKTQTKAIRTKKTA